MYMETQRLPPKPPSSAIRFSRIHPEPLPPPLPPRPMHYSPRKPPQIPAPLLPVSSVSPPPTPTKKAPWIMATEPPPEDSAATMVSASWAMLVCGTVTMLLCFFGMAQSGRKYYLDSGLLAGSTSLTVGLLGLRARRWTRLPNRNFVTGYIVLAVFSALTSVGLVGLLAVRRLHGAGPIVDLIGGAECGIALLTMLLAAGGVVASACCRRSPPDNRISHCAEGLTL